MANYLENLGELGFDNITNGVGVPVVTGLRTILAGQGVLARGTALALNADNKLIVLGSAEGTANCILAEAVDTTNGDTNAMVYLSGQFNRNKLTVAEGYEITFKDTEEFRKGGIILANSME